MKTITEAIEEAEKADGYLVTITTLDTKTDKLLHTNFTRNFRKADIMSSLDEQAKLLEPEAR